MYTYTAVAALFHRLGAADQMNAVWVTHATTLYALQQYRDEAGRYIVVGRPCGWTLLGRPVVLLSGLERGLMMVGVVGLHPKIGYVDSDHEVPMDRQLDLFDWWKQFIIDKSLGQCRPAGMR